MFSGYTNGNFDLLGVKQSFKLVLCFVGGENKYLGNKTIEYRKKGRENIWITFVTTYP